MSYNAVIEVKNISKTYHIFDTPKARLFQMFLPAKKLYREFWALKDINFTIEKGESVGIIGRNGSGKSTLLQLICGTLNQTTGKIITHGRIAALLELGSGFNPEFTGRENIYLNAAVLGLSKKEIDERFDRIADFADIGQFIDQPIKNYSSGMIVRLAFAVQAQIDPDILIVDEALAVGDARFQAKCFDRLRQLRENGTTILLVTHSSEQIVAHCTKAILLDGGQVQQIGEPRQIVNRYMDLLFGREKKILLNNNSEHSEKTAEIEQKKDKSITMLNQQEDVFSSRPCHNQYEYRWGDGLATILDYHLHVDGKTIKNRLPFNKVATLDLSIRFNGIIARPILGFTLKNKEGLTIYGCNSELLDAEVFSSLTDSQQVALVRLTFNTNLASGDYFISLGIASREQDNIIPHDRRYDAIHFIILPVEKFYGLTNLNLDIKKIG